VETIPAAALHGRLRGLGAQYQADRSSQQAHIYWAPASRRWIKVVRAGANVTLTYHATCPCSGG
jgi:hypothetical protein